MSFKKGQSLLEYGVLFCVVLSSLLIMQYYVRRAYSGRLKAEADSVGMQYAPKNTSSNVTTIAHTVSDSYTGGIIKGKNGQDIVVPDGMTVTIADTDTNFERREVVDSFASK